MTTDHVRERAGAEIARTALRRAATLLLAGQLLYIAVTQFHTGGDANDHPVIFAEYASSDIWKAVHVGQFIAMAVFVAGLLALFFALDVPTGGGASLVGRLGAASAIVTLGLYAVLQAVDGIGNKEVDDAWVSAQSDDETSRFASAEAMRWLEWGMRSYHDYALSLALLLLAVAALRTSGIPQAVGYLIGLSGIAYLAQGWVVGADGFSDTHTILILVAWALSLAWMTWLVVIASRSRGPEARRVAG